MTEIELLKLLLKGTYDYYVVPAMDQEMKAKFFPPSAEQQILEGVKELDSKINALTEEVAKLRVQPTQTALIKSLDHYRLTFIPIMVQQSGRETPNEAILKSAADALGKQCDTLRSDISVGWNVFSDKVSTFDFTSRLLLSLIKQMYALRIAMLSWTRALMSRHPGNEDYIELLTNEMITLSENAPKRIKQATEKLEKARLDQVSFSISIKSKPKYNRDIGQYFPVYSKVYCEYIDTFESHHATDPFKQKKIKNYVNDRAGSTESFFIPDAVQVRLSGNASMAEKWEKQHDTNKKKTEGLLETEVSQGAVEFEKAWTEILAEKQKVP